MNKNFLKLKYPKFLLLILTFVLAYIIFQHKYFSPFQNTLSYLGYFGIFLTGIFFVYGFTAAPATAILLIIAKEQNLIFAGLIAGLGALVGDLIIFKLIRSSFKDEIKKLSREKFVKQLDHSISKPIQKYFILVLAGFIISSPLPDEIGVSLLAASTKLSIKIFSIISYLLNTAGIFVILIIGSLI